MLQFIPFAGLRHLHLVPQFLRELGNDFSILRKTDLSVTFTVPDRSEFPDEFSYAVAIHELKRRHKIAVVKQAVHKQAIKDSLWRRVRVCWGLFSIVTVPFCILTIIVWIVCLNSNPSLYRVFNPLFWF